MKILVATDFSTRSRQALRRAGLLARDTGSDLTITHVVEDDQPPPLVELETRESERYLAELTGTLAELRGLSCRSVVVAGDAFDGILRTAESAAADLIVMGAHRKQFLRDVFTGTTIERVIRTGPFPILMVNSGATHPYRQVLAAVDMTEPSVNAVRTGKALGLAESANLALVHGFEAMAKGKMSFAGIETDQIDEYIAEERLRAGAELNAYFEANGIDVDGWSRCIEEGSPFQVISRAAQELNPDLLIVGTHGRTGIAKAFLGSVAEEVLRSIETDILAVPLAHVGA